MTANRAENLQRALRTAAFMLLGTAMCIGSQPASAAERDVTFQGYGGTPIVGTLTIPDSAEVGTRFPAVLLLQGSGPTDRDGNQPPDFQSNLLRQIASALAKNGIASLRYDKRGLHANKETMPKTRELFPDFFSWDAFVGDAHAAFSLLSAHSTIAPGRVGMVGHSEGGLIALALSAEYQPQPKSLILIGTPGRPLGEIIEDQLIATLTVQKATMEQREFFLAADRRIRAHILAEGRVPDDVPPGLAPLYPWYLGPFLKSELALNPLTLVTNVRGPILVINGAADQQVSATKDAARFVPVLASRKDGSEVVVPASLSHSLKTVDGPDSRGRAGDVDGGVQDLISRWLKNTL